MTLPANYSTSQPRVRSKERVERAEVQFDKQVMAISGPMGANDPQMAFSHKKLEGVGSEEEQPESNLEDL
jgi:hypothetical protein